MLTRERVLYNRRQVLKIGRKALIVIGVVSLYPFGHYLTAKKNPLVEARLPLSKMTLTEDWQQLEQTRFWLRQGNNEVEAIWASCTHLGCEVNYVRDQKQWACPCHGSRYSSEGQPIKGPAVKPLPRAKLREKDGFYLLQQPLA